jgi:hypothetical protein
VLRIGCEDSNDPVGRAIDEAVLLLSDRPQNMPVTAGAFWLHLLNRKGFFVTEGELPQALHSPLTPETKAAGTEFAVQALNHAIGKGLIAGDPIGHLYWRKP